MDHLGGKPDLIILDCDGVLVDSEVLSCRCLADTLAQYGIELSLDQALDLFLGRSVSAVLQHYAELGRSIPDDFQNDLKRRVRETFEASLKPISDVDAVLTKLATPHCVASSSGLDRVSFSLKLTGLARFFGDRL